MGRPPFSEGFIIKRSLYHDFLGKARFVRLLTGLIAMAVWSIAPAFSSDNRDRTVAVGSVQTALTIRAYAQVAVVARAYARAPVSGVLSGLTLLPGDRARAGEQVARLTGPQRAAALAALTLRRDQAKVRLHLAGQERSIVKQKFHGRLSTRRDLDRAQAAFEKAENDLATASAALQSARVADRITVPADGIVTSIAATDGEWVKAGAVVATLVPAQGLWLSANVFGQDARQVRIGMAGTFQPAGGGAAVAVHVVRLLPNATPDGGRRVALLPNRPKPAGWNVGAAGQLTLRGPSRRYAAIPTRALVLDRGRWWVLVATTRGTRRREVVPGPARGDETLIRSGLKAGDRVVVTQAYLHFHRDFARHYQPPD